jgi:hypothetical protein
MAMNIKNKYEIGQPVFLVTDPEQIPGMIISIRVSKLGLTYEVRFDCEVLDLYEMEITDRVDELKKMGVYKEKEK